MTTPDLPSSSDLGANFCFPIKELSNQRVKLIAFDPCKHASEYFSQTASYPEIYAHQAMGPFSSADDFVKNFVLKKVVPDPTTFLWAIIDKLSPSNAPDKEVIAGIVAYMASSAINDSTEIGYVNIFPAFQRTHVTTNAIGLLLHYALDSEEEGGLALRRVEWQTNSVNVASLRTAERLGFKKEAILKWHRIFHDGREKGKLGNGRSMPRNGNEKNLGRDTILLSLCWDDWEEGGREHVQALMDRK